MCRTHIFVIALLIVTSACSRVQPQGAANKQEADSVAIALMQMNLQLAMDADKALTDFVKTSDLPYVLDLSNFWYYRQTVTEGREVKEGMRVEYSAEVRNLATGALIEEVTEEVTVGKRATLRAIDICLGMMREGETYLLLAPYYNAYGRDGNEWVEPLTNVTIKLTAEHLIIDN